MNNDVYSDSDEVQYIEEEPEMQFVTVVDGEEENNQEFQRPKKRHCTKLAKLINISRRYMQRWLKNPPMLSMNSSRKTKWDLFVMILATYNCFQIPLEVAFAPPQMFTPGMKLLTALIDFCFLIDIIVSFRTTFIDDKNGAEIYD